MVIAETISVGSRNEHVIAGTYYFSPEIAKNIIRLYQPIDYICSPKSGLVNKLKIFTL